MAYKRKDPKDHKPKGFAAMSRERRVEIARSGGAAVPAEKRAFATHDGLAASAGTKGGQNSRGGGRKPASEA